MPSEFDENQRKLLTSAAQVFRENVSSGSRFASLLDIAAQDSELAPPHDDAALPGRSLPGSRDLNMLSTRRLARSLQAGAPQVGDMPPQPPTLRGRIGAVLVGIVRRALFWYTGQIREFQSRVVDAASEQTLAFQDMAAQQRRLRAQVSDLLRKMAKLQGELQELKANQQGALAEIERRLHAAAGDLRQDTSNELLFVEHAKSFRGEREEIKGRLAVYLPYAREAFAATAGLPALDLGCGRGEWLELLSSAAIPGKGIDRNRTLVQHCRDLGLGADEGSVPDCLYDLHDQSLSLITAFHIIEHIPFQNLLDLVDQAVRILKPGGILILETPNPQNIFVSSYSFYADPTHRHPVPGEFLSFLVGARGLCDPEIISLAPYPDSFRLPASECPAVQFINDHFYGPRDYGLVARKR